METIKLDSTIIIWAVPFYLFMIGLEILVSYLEKKKVYDKKEAISNMACGVVQQTFDAAFNLLLIPFYVFINKNYAIFNIESSLYVIVLFFILKDFMYYWVHRFSHKIPFFWGIHLVHHQPKVYNFSVGLRAPLLHNIVDVFPLMLFALLGFPIEVFVPVSVIWISLQILTHTTYIKKEIPLFSKIFVTPSHHRVHHGKNQVYLDKNFSAVFSFWDRLFNSYQKELTEHPVEFGVLNEKEYTLDPIGANFIYWKNLKSIFEVTSISSLKLIIIILSGSFFIINAKTLSVVQAFIQAALLLVIFELLIKRQNKF